MTHGESIFGINNLLQTCLAYPIYPDAVLVFCCERLEFVNKLPQGLFIQPTLKDTILHPLTIILQQVCYLASLFVIRFFARTSQCRGAGQPG